MLYCVIPAELGRKLRRPFERHFEGSKALAVIVEQRRGERRVPGDRRAPTSVWVDDDRRLIGNFHGRRVGERRAALVPALATPELPRRARSYGARIAFAARIELPERQRSDIECGRLAVRVQGGDIDAFGELYARYFDGVYAYLRLAFQSEHVVEGALQAIFAQALSAIQEFDASETSFRMWFTRLLYGHAPGGDETVAALIDDAAVPVVADAASVELLEWLTDADLRMLIERLPSLEREVMGLCYIFDLTANEIGWLIGSDADTVEQIHARSIHFMERCLTSLGRRPGYTGRHPIRAAHRNSPVTRGRRLALARS